MKKEQHITKETLKLGKEKGFNVQPSVTNLSTDEEFYTQSLLQKWIREKYGLHITIYISWENNGKLATYGYETELTKTEYKWYKYVTDDNFKTYENALEYGLFRCLEMIKK